MRIQRHRTRFSLAVVLAVAAMAVPARTPATAQATDRVSAQPTAATQRPTLSFVDLALGLMWTGGVPDSRGDGAAQTGVGLDLMLTGGAQGSLGPLRYRVVPTLLLSQNRDHQTFPSGDPTRHPLASPFYFGPYSADLPSRPGDDRRATAALGETGIWWSGDRAFVGLLATTPDWGPSTRGVGEGLVLGRSAPGLPRVEVAFAWHPQVGAVRLRWFSGVAQESEWFDADGENNTRLLSGARAEVGADANKDGVRVGLARTVMSASGRGTLRAALHPVAAFSGDPVIDIVSADMRYHHGEGGITAWIEVARQDPLTGVRDFLRFPTKGIAFRAGFTQRLARSERAEWLASMELVRLDQSGSTSAAAPTDFYTSARVIHGWTHRGQPLGSGLGPGGQRQFARLDRMGRAWRLGAFVERVRRNEDALYRQAPVVGEWHDVTLQAGLTAARRFGNYDVAARLSAGKRLNYLFQGAGSAAGADPVDVQLIRFGLSFTPAGDSRRIVGVLPES